MHSRLLLIHFSASHLSHQSESSLGVIRTSFERMDQWGAHIGELSRTDLPHWAPSESRQLHFYILRTNLRFGPSHLRRLHSTSCSIASHNPGSTGPILGARVLARLCPAPDAATSSLRHVSGSSTTSRTSHHLVPHLPTRDRTPRP